MRLTSDNDLDVHVIARRDESAGRTVAADDR
jgi:hypothetical protein